MKLAKILQVSTLLLIINLQFGMLPVQAALSVSPIEKTQSYSVPVELIYGTQANINSPISVTVFDNDRGNLYKINWDFSGVLSHNGTVSFTDTPNGGVIARQQSLITIDFLPQNGQKLLLPETFSVTLACVGGITCSGAGPRIYSEPQSFNETWYPATKGYISSAGGNVPLNVTTSVTNGYGSISGLNTITGNIGITYTYDDRSALDYAFQILEKAKSISSSNATAIDLADDFYTLAINSRHRDLNDVEAGLPSYTASSVNKNIRDVEYFGRGYHGGLLARNQDSIKDPNGVFNSIVPISSPIYEGVKVISRSLGLSTADNTLQSSEAFTGLPSAFDGYKFGILQVPIEDAIRQHFNGNSNTNQNLIPPTKPASPTNPTIPPTKPASPTNPTIPLGTLNLDPIINSPQLTANISTFALNIDNLDSLYYFDPKNASNYIVSYAGVKVGGFLVPDYDSILDTFEVLIGSDVFNLNEGQYFDISQLTSTNKDTDYFVLKGVSPDLDHFVIGLNFDSKGFGLLGITEINVTAVPEPETYSMILVGLCLIGFMKRHRKLKGA